jgi:hypothetical protein
MRRTTWADPSPNISLNLTVDLSKLQDDHIDRAHDKRIHVADAQYLGL